MFRTYRLKKTGLAYTGCALAVCLSFAVVNLALGASLNWTADQDVTVGSNILTVISGSVATTFTINSSNLVVAIPASSSFVITSNSASLSYTGLTSPGMGVISCTSGTPRLTITTGASPETVTITPAGSTCSEGGGGGLPAGAYDAPIIPAGGFNVLINNGSASTTSQNVTLTFNAGSDVKKMAISNTSDFNGIGQENYSPTKSWDLCAGLSSCSLGTKTVYVKFYTSFGQPSAAVSSSINLTQAGQATPVPPTSQTTLINSNGTFYLIQNGTRQGIANPGILFTYGFDFKDARVATSADMSIPLGSNLTPKDGALVKTSANPTVYLISNSQKHGFTSANVFLTLGYKFPTVLIVTTPELDIVPLGEVIATTTQRHVKGTNVSSSGTIYYLGDTQRFPYPSIQVFNSWNIDNDFSRVVPANSEDLKLLVGNVLGMR